MIGGLFENNLRPIVQCTITEKAPLVERALSWLKVPAFTFKTLLRHYAKRALTHGRHEIVMPNKSHKGWAGWLAYIHVVSYIYLSLMIIALASQFHASRHFQPEEGPSRGLLRDCENWLWNRWIVCSTAPHWCQCFIKQRDCAVLSKSIHHEDLWSITR